MKRQRICRATSSGSVLSVSVDEVSGSVRMRGTSLTRGRVQSSGQSGGFPAGPAGPRQLALNPPIRPALARATNRRAGHPAVSRSGPAGFSAVGRGVYRGTGPGRSSPVRLRATGCRLQAHRTRRYLRGVTGSSSYSPRRLLKTLLPKLKGSLPQVDYRAEKFGAHGESDRRGCRQPISGYEFVMANCFV